MLFLSPIIFALSVFMSLIYGYQYLLFTTFPLVFESTYHFSPNAVGLTYLGTGVGAVIGVLVFSFWSDSLVQKYSENGVMRPEYRLPPMVYGSFFVPVGLFCYGWAAQEHVHWIVPILGTSFVGFGLLVSFMSITTYIVDAYPVHAASGVAATTVMRSVLGAVLPLAGPKMYEQLGLGWGNTLLGFIALLLCPTALLIYRWGEKLRTHPRFKRDW
jgi:MFS family permease